MKKPSTLVQIRQYFQDHPGPHTLDDLDATIESKRPTIAVALWRLTVRKELVRNGEPHKHGVSYSLANKEAAKVDVPF